jgi:hypothetical protein
LLPPTCRLIDSWPLMPRARTAIVCAPLLLLDEEELELLLELELELELLLDELLDDDELELLLDEELEPPPAGTSTVQAGSLKLPSWLPCTPKPAL